MFNSQFEETLVDFHVEMVGVISLKVVFKGFLNFLVLLQSDGSFFEIFIFPHEFMFNSQFEYTLVDFYNKMTKWWV